MNHQNTAPVIALLHQVSAVSNRGPRPLLGRGVPTRYWEGTPDILAKLPILFYQIAPIGYLFHQYVIFPKTVQPRSLTPPSRVS